MSENKHNNEIDSEFEKIGEFGPYQLLIFVLVGLTSFLPAIFAYSYMFISATPDFRCKLPNYENDTFDIIDDYHNNLVDFYIPFKTENKIEVYDRCNLYNRNFTYTLWNNTIADIVGDHNSTNKYKCNEWVFSKQYYGKTIVTDWKFLCEDTTKKALFTTLYFIGSYGVLLIGILSDRFGRKLIAYCFIILNAIFSILMAIILNIGMNLQAKQSIYAAMRFLTGITSNVYSTAVVLAVEVTGPSRRVIAANCIYYFYIIGEFLTALICYFVRDYDKLYIVFAAIMTVYALYFWVVPESPRWLITKGRYKDAYSILKRIAKANRKVMPAKFETFMLKETNNTNVVVANAENNSDKKSISFFKAIKTIAKSKKLIFRSISILFNWLANNLVYYGISLSAVQLAGDPYLNFTLMTIVELFAVVVSQFALQYLGRKIPYVVNMLFAGLSCLAVIFIPKQMTALIVIMALIGKFSISFTYSGIYVITPEIYPTSIRTTTVSTCQACARIGSVIAPYINLLGELYWYPFPFIIYGTIAVIASVLTVFFVPESKGKELPETFDDS